MRTLHGKLICLFLAALLCGAIICKADDAACRTAHPVASATVHGYLFRTIDPAMWGEMLHYTYTGRAPLAWRLVDASWPVNKPGKEAFLAAICGNLGKSVFWRELSASAEGQPPACTHAAEEK